MKLFIAEKPSLARAIVDVLPKPHKKNDGFIEAGNGDVVTWCIGHLLEQSPPEDYDVKYKKWVTEHLPIIPQQWQLKPKSKTRKQLTVIKKLVKKADLIVNAGDVDRVTINHHKFDTSFLLYYSMLKVIFSLHKLDAATKLKTLTKHLQFLTDTCTKSVCS